MKYRIVKVDTHDEFGVITNTEYNVQERDVDIIIIIMTLIFYIPALILMQYKMSFCFWHDVTYKKDNALFSMSYKFDSIQEAQTFIDDILCKKIPRCGNNMTVIKECKCCKK